MIDSDKTVHEPNSADKATIEASPPIDTKRRAALAQLGTLAAYTAPAMLAAMTAAQAQSMSISQPTTF